MQNKNVMPVVKITLQGLAVIFTAMLLVLVLSQIFKAKEASSISFDLGGPFKLAATTGGVVDSQNLVDKPFAVFFGFTHCPEICPTTLNDMSTSLKELGPEAKDFPVYFVTVDPARDTLPFVKDYIANFDPRIVGLVPTEAELAQLAKSFRVIYEKVPTSDGSYTMNHTASVYLMKGEGKLASVISYNEKPETRLKKLQKLLNP